MKYYKNINIFETINTEQKAYWLGILMADGCVAWSKNKNGIKLYGIKFGLTDIDIMDKWKNFLEIDKSFPYQVLNQKNCQPVYYLYITCHKMAKDLGKHGMIPNKAYRTYIPEMDKNLIRHFIRGYFDGDGCLFLKERKYKSGTNFIQKMVSITSCSEKILYQIEQICKESNLIRTNKNHIKVSKIYKNKKYPPLFQLTNRMDIHNFLNWIYKDATIYMERKYKSYLSIKNDNLYHKQKNNDSKYNGVSIIKTKNPNLKKKYSSFIKHNNIVYRQNFYTENEAALFYNDKVKELGLPESLLNKIDPI